MSRIVVAAKIGEQFVRVEVNPRAQIGGRRPRKLSYVPTGLLRRGGVGKLALLIQ